MKKAIISLIEVFAFVVWPFGGVWQFLSSIIGGGVQESFLYPIYGGIILLLKYPQKVRQYFEVKNVQAAERACCL